MQERSDVAVTVAAEQDVDVREVLPLYEAVGWTAYTAAPETLAAALAGSTRVVVARAGDRVVGLARVLSDRATVCYVQDVLVHPDLHRTGVGSRLLTAAFEPFDRVRQHVLLTDADPGQRAFYERSGFVEVHDHPVGLRAFVRFAS